MALMIWCVECKTVVYALDHEPRMDARGLLNQLRVPCPRCGDGRGTFDSWGKANDAVIEATYELEGLPDIHGGDVWSYMRFLAKGWNLVWAPHPTNLWFEEELQEQVCETIESFRSSVEDPQ